MKIIGHIPVKFLQVVAKFDRKHRGAAERIRVPGGGVKVSCIYFSCGTKVHKSSV